jgi:hypothetical protein
VKVRGRLSFQDAAARRTAERHVEALVAAGVAPDAVRVEGLTLVVAAEAPMTRRCAPRCVRSRRRRGAAR